MRLGSEENTKRLLCHSDFSLSANVATKTNSSDGPGAFPLEEDSCTSGPAPERLEAVSIHTFL